jgi:hypothetical protein
MGWLSVVMGTGAAIILYGADGGPLFWAALVATGLALWSWGVMHNFAIEAARKRSSFEGGFYDITEEEADSVPNWLAAVNLLATLGCGGLLVAGIVKML